MSTTCPWTRWGNPSGGNLTQSTALDEDVTLNVATGALLELRDVSGNSYVKIDLSALSSLPDVNIPPSDIARSIRSSGVGGSRSRPV